MKRLFTLLAAFLLLSMAAAPAFAADKGGKSDIVKCNGTTGVNVPARTNTSFPDATGSLTWVYPITNGSGTTEVSINVEAGGFEAVEGESVPVAVGVWANQTPGYPYLEGDPVFTYYGPKVAGPNGTVSFDIPVNEPGAWDVLIGIDEAMTWAVEIGTPGCVFTPVVQYD